MNKQPNTRNLFEIEDEYTNNVYLTRTRPTTPSQFEEHCHRARDYHIEIGNDDETRADYIAEYLKQHYGYVELDYSGSYQCWRP